MKPFRWCRDLSELHEFISYLVVYAPSNFPKEDDLDLDRAMSELRHGLESVRGDFPAVLVEQVRTSFEEAELKFRSGEEVEAAHILQRADRLLRT